MDLKVHRYEPEPAGDGPRYVDPIRCTACGVVESLDAYDVLGLDDGDLCCNHCGHIGPMESVEDEEGG